MASVKNLKKDINFLTEEVIGTCFLHHFIQEGNAEKQAAIDKIINDIIGVRNELVEKINNKEKDAKDVPSKKFYREISEQLMEEVDKAFDAIANVNG